MILSFLYFFVAESSSALARIKVFAEAVADEVEGKDREGDGDAGKDQCVWGGLKGREIASFFDHHAPRWRGWGYAEAEERQRRFGEDGSGHTQTRLHYQGLNRIRKDVDQQDTKITGAERACGLDEVVFTDL